MKPQSVLAALAVPFLLVFTGLSTEAGPDPTGRWRVMRTTESAGDEVERFLQSSRDELSNERWLIQLSNDRLVIQGIGERLNEDGGTTTVYTRMPLVRSQYKEGKLVFVTQETSSDPILGRQMFTESFAIRFNPDGQSAVGRWQSEFGSGPEDPDKISRKGTVRLRRIVPDSESSQTSSAVSTAEPSQRRELTRSERRARIAVIDAQLRKVRSNKEQQERSVEFAREHNEKNPGFSSAQMLSAAERLLQTYENQERRLEQERASLEE